MSDHPQFATEYLSLRNMVAKNRSAESLTDAQLIHLGELASDPASPSACIDWAEREAVPLLRELAKRLKALRSGPWFSFDGMDFESHPTEQDAKVRAEMAMSDFQSEASDDGWDDVADQVCYGPITHSVRVEEREANEEERSRWDCDQTREVVMVEMHLEPVHKL